MTTAIELGISPDAIGKQVKLQPAAFNDGRVIHGPHEMTPEQLSRLPWQIIDVNHTIFFAAPVTTDSRGNEHVLNHLQRYFRKDAHILAAPEE